MSRKTAEVVAVKDGKITNEALGLIQRKANDAARRIEDGSRSIDDILDGFQAVLEGWKNIDFDIWRVIDINTFKDLDGLREALSKYGVRVSDPAFELLGKLELNKPRETLALVLKSQEDLGLSPPNSLDEIYQAGLDCGYELCPPELAPYLRVEYQDQPKVENLVVAMEPIERTSSVGGASLFMLHRHGGALGLCTVIYYRDSRLASRWHKAYKFVFVKRRFITAPRPSEL